MKNKGLLLYIPSIVYVGISLLFRSTLFSLADLAVFSLTGKYFFFFSQIPLNATVSIIVVYLITKKLKSHIPPYKEDIILPWLAVIIQILYFSDYFFTREEFLSYNGSNIMASLSLDLLQQALILFIIYHVVKFFFSKEEDEK